MAAYPGPPGHSAPLDDHSDHLDHLDTYIHVYTIVLSAPTAIVMLIRWVFYCILILLDRGRALGHTNYFSSRIREMFHNIYRILSAYKVSQSMPFILAVHIFMTPVGVNIWSSSKWPFVEFNDSKCFNILIVLMNSTSILEPICWESFFLMINFNDSPFFREHV